MIKFLRDEEQNIFKKLLVFLVLIIIIFIAGRYVARWVIFNTVVEHFASLGSGFTEAHESMSSEFKEKTEQFEKKFSHVIRGFANQYPALKRPTAYEQVALLAAEQGDLELLKYFIEEKELSVNSFNAVRSSLVTKAAVGGSLPVVKYLTEKGADIDYPNLNKMGPISFAAYNKYPEIVKYLLTYDIGWYGEHLHSLTIRIADKAGVSSSDRCDINEDINSIFNKGKLRNVYPEYAKRYPGKIDPDYMEILIALKQSIIDRPTYMRKRPYMFIDNSGLARKVPAQLKKARRLFAEADAMGKE